VELPLTGISLVDWSAKLVFQLQHRLLADAEIGVHRIALVHGREQRRVGGDHPTDTNQCAAHEPVDRRGNLGITEVELGILDPCLCALDLCGGGVVGCHGRIELPLTQSIDRGQRTGSLQVPHRLRALSACLSERGLRLEEGILKGPGIDLEERLPAGHPRAFHGVLSVEDSADLRANLHRVRRLELSRIIAGDRGRRVLHRQSRDRHWRWRCRGLAAAARREHHAGEHDQTDRPYPVETIEPARATHCYDLSQRDDGDNSA
jgi:hypothetical protein